MSRRIRDLFVALRQDSCGVRYQYASEPFLVRLELAHSARHLDERKK